ncbi:MAG: hypothetical protein HYW33_00020 [Candidatus Blackburnbacteria bacterium]|nr:hypothetical protein [Candidatus Blackburnbacteria bacterium]
MSDNKFLIGSIVSDLRRASLYMHLGSLSTASHFAHEAIETKKRVNMEMISPHVARILEETEKTLKKPDGDHKAEDILMYSILLQNFAQKYI